MDKNKLIQRMLPLVTDIKWERLEDYLNYERGILIEKLVSSSDIRTINKLQGEIKQMDLILALPTTIKHRVATS